MLKNRSSNEKAGIYIIGFMIILIIVVLLLYFLGIIGGDGIGSDVIVDNSIMFRYSRKKWSIVDSRDYTKYNWNKYMVYEQGDKKGKYSVYGDDNKFYVFKESKNSREPINIVGDSIFLGGKIKSKFYSFNEEDITSSDLKYVHEVLDKYKISRSEQNKYTHMYKISFDFDKDNKNEVMYVVSNLFNEGVDVSNSFSDIFIKDGNSLDTIYKKIYGKDKNLSGCYAYLYGIISVDKFDKYQLITKCSYYSVNNTNEFGLYQYDNNGYRLLLYSK